MIYGQSGGGSKVTTLLGMPSAAGLIHRASAQSGGGGNLPTAEQSREFAKRVIAELGVTALAKKMATAWASFARTGDPSQPGLPWAPFDPVRCPTMVFDDVCRIVDDPEAEARRLLLS